MKKGEHSKDRLTERGFVTYCTVVDKYQQTVRVQESSLATGSCVWIFCKDKDGASAIEHLGKLQSRSPHLTPSQARVVAAALLRFADVYGPRRKNKREADRG